MIIKEEEKIAFAGSELWKRYVFIRNKTVAICGPLKTEDYVLQPVVDISPPKWHLAHTTWFFENFILKKIDGYKLFHQGFHFLFNSYYESEGKRVIRRERGFLSRPTVEEVLAYRNYVDEAIHRVLENPIPQDLLEILELGLQHEQQHQELLLTDIKFLLGHNPLYPPYDENSVVEKENGFSGAEDVFVDEGLYEIGFKGEGFSFDNEHGRHKVFLEPYVISGALITNEQYLEFMKDGGYRNFRFWHNEGWEWVEANKISAPLYWVENEMGWQRYALHGLEPVDPNSPVTHVNFYEASAFASWAGKRLPTEFEWEVAAPQLRYGLRWEWTSSAYLPYPRYAKADGAIGEYNGKFMVNQMVLRGSSVATPEGHSRLSYRNFFHPHLRWQFSGMRLCRSV